MEWLSIKSLVWTWDQWVKEACLILKYIPAQKWRDIVSGFCLKVTHWQLQQAIVQICVFCEWENVLILWNKAAIQFLGMKSIINVKIVRKYCAQQNSQKNVDETFSNFSFIRMLLSSSGSEVKIYLFNFIFFKIHYWVERAPLNISQLHFLSNETSKWAKTCLPSEGFDAKLFKNASSKFFKF